MSARVDIVRLAALAAAATPGPWTYRERHAAVYAGRHNIASTWGNNLYANAPFIAAADPGVVAALVEAVQAALEYDELASYDLYPHARVMARVRLRAALAVFGDESPEPFEAQSAESADVRGGNSTVKGEQ